MGFEAVFVVGGEVGFDVVFDKGGSTGFDTVFIFAAESDVGSVGFAAGFDTGGGGVGFVAELEASLFEWPLLPERLCGC